jgi:hypothetical protein
VTTDQVRGYAVADDEPGGDAERVEHERLDRFPPGHAGDGGDGVPDDEVTDVGVGEVAARVVQGPGGPAAVEHVPAQGRRADLSGIGRQAAGVAEQVAQGELAA